MELKTYSPVDSKLVFENIKGCLPQTLLGPFLNTLSHIYHTKQYQAFYKKIKCDLINFRGALNGYHQNLQYLMVSIQFFIEMATLM